MCIRDRINSIVLEEESDVDALGNPASHYEMYLDAMEQCGADTNTIKDFVSNVYEKNIPSVNSGVDSFLKFTFDIINSKEPHKIAAAFTFGREDLIPDMFTAIVEEYNSNNNLNKFLYYLERHIELDGDEHGPMAITMIKNLCGESEVKWNEVIEASKQALQMRINLWDSINEKITQNF